MCYTLLCSKDIGDSNLALFSNSIKVNLTHNQTYYACTNESERFLERERERKRKKVSLKRKRERARERDRLRKRTQERRLN